MSSGFILLEIYVYVCIEHKGYQVLIIMTYKSFFVKVLVDADRRFKHEPKRSIL